MTSPKRGLNWSPAGYVNLTRLKAENAIYEVEKREEKARVGLDEIHSTLPPPTLTHTPNNTSRERIED